MPNQVRQKHSGALIFHPTKDDKAVVRDRRKLKDLEKEVKEMKELINSLKEQVKK
jgi:hypothetical protein